MFAAAGCSARLVGRGVRLVAAGGVSCLAIYDPRECRFCACPYSCIPWRVRRCVGRWSSVLAWGVIDG